MSSKKLSYLLIVLVCLSAAGLIGSAIAANSLLSRKSAELSKAKAESQVADELQQSLKKSKEDIVKYSELNAIAKTVVPQDKDQSQTVGEIVKIAADSGILNLTSITFPASTLGGAGTARSSNNLTQLTPVKGIAGVYVLPITITQDGNNTVSYDSFVAFLRKLENNRRTAQVSSINIQPDSIRPTQIRFTLIVNEYLKP